MTLLETLILWSMGWFIGGGIRYFIDLYRLSVPAKKKRIDQRKLQKWLEYK